MLDFLTFFLAFLLAVVSLLIICPLVILLVILLPILGIIFLPIYFLLLIFNRGDTRDARREEDEGDSRCSREV